MRALSSGIASATSIIRSIFHSSRVIWQPFLLHAAVASGGRRSRTAPDMVEGWAEDDAAAAAPAAVLAPVAAAAN